MASAISDTLLARRGHTRHSSIPQATPSLYGSKGLPSPAGSNAKSPSRLSPLRMPKSKTTNDLSSSRIPKLSTPPGKIPKTVVTPQRKLMAPLGPPLPTSQTLSAFTGAPNASPVKRNPKLKQDTSSPRRMGNTKEIQRASGNAKLSKEEIAWFHRQNEETIRARASSKDMREFPVPTSQRRAAIPEDFPKSPRLVHRFVRKSTPGPFVSSTSSSGITALQSLSGSESSASTYPVSPVSMNSSFGMDDDPRSVYFPMPASYFLGRLSTLLDRKRQEDSFSSRDLEQRDTLKPPSSTVSEAHEMAEARRTASAVAELRAWCKSEEASYSFNRFIDQYYALQRRKIAVARPTAGPYPPQTTSSNTAVFKTPPPPDPAPVSRNNAKVTLRGSNGGDRKPNGNNTFGGLVKSKTMGSLRRLPSMKFANAWSGKHNDHSDASMPKTPQTASKRTRRATTTKGDDDVQDSSGVVTSAKKQATRGLRRRHTDVGKQQAVQIPPSATIPISKPMPTKFLPLHTSASSPVLLSHNPPPSLVSPTTVTKTSTTTSTTPKTPKFATPKTRMSNANSQTQSESSSRKSSGTSASVAGSVTRAFVEGIGGTLRRFTSRRFTGTGSGSEDAGLGAHTIRERLWVGDGVTEEKAKEGGGEHERTRGNGKGVRVSVREKSWDEGFGH